MLRLSYFFNKFSLGLPCNPMVKTVLPMQGAWVRSLVGELSSCTPHSAAKNLKTKQNQTSKLSQNDVARNTNSFLWTPTPLIVYDTCLAHTCCHILSLLINTCVPAPQLNHNYPEGQNHYEIDSYLEDTFKSMMGRLNFIFQNVFTDVSNLCATLLIHSSIVYMDCGILYLTPCDTSAYNKGYLNTEHWLTLSFTESSFSTRSKLKSSPSPRKLSAKELMLLNCGVGEDSGESHGLQGDPTSPS